MSFVEVYRHSCLADYVIICLVTGLPLLNSQFLFINLNILGVFFFFSDSHFSPRLCSLTKSGSLMKNDQSVWVRSVCRAKPSSVIADPSQRSFL